MIYGRTHTRMIDEQGGLASRIPVLAAFFVLTGLTSLGLPGPERVSRGACRLHRRLPRLPRRDRDVHHGDRDHRVLRAAAAAEDVLRRGDGRAGSGGGHGASHHAGTFGARLEIRLRRCQQGGVRGPGAPHALHPRRRSVPASLRPADQHRRGARGREAGGM